MNSKRACDIERIGCAGTAELTVGEVIVSGPFTVSAVALSTVIAPILGVWKVSTPCGLKML